MPNYAADSSMKRQNSTDSLIGMKKQAGHFGLGLEALQEYGD